MLKRLLPLLFITTLGSGIAVAATMKPAVMDPMAEKIKMAMKSKHRTDKEKMRDENRMPVETLKFLGIKDDMKVLELMPGRGWYTKLLAPALKEKGEIYSAVYTHHLEKLIPTTPELANVKITNGPNKPKWDSKIGLANFTDADFKVRNIDAVLTFRNYHNFTYEGRMTMNKAAFDALKPGGIYGVVDHTRRHMQGDSDENHRRVDPVLAIKEIQASGFEFVDYSDLHYRTDDELRYEVGRRSVHGNSDRFTFLFKKPMK